MRGENVDENYADFKAKDGCFGLTLTRRGINDNHLMIELLSEDDGNWWIESTFSSYYLDAYIDMLLKAKKELETNPRFKKDKKEGGYRF